MAPRGLIAQGVAALRAGDPATARTLLAAAVRADPADPQAWLWLSGALPEPAAQRYCLERALALDPTCEPARLGLKALEKREADAEARRPGPPAPALPAPVALRAAQPLVATRAASPALGRPDPAAPAPPASLRPGLAMWLRPRAAFRAAVARPGLWQPWLLAALAGVSAVLAWAAGRRLGEAAGPFEILALALLVGLPLGLAALLLGGVLLRTGGRLLGGQGSARQVRAALALAAAPVVLGLPLWLVQLAALPQASFGGAPGGPLAGLPAQGLLALACWALHGALWAWAVALSCIGLAEAHSIGLARAAASWLMAALAVAGAIGLLLGGAAVVIGLRGG